MAMTLERLKALCEREGLKYFLAPDRPMVMMGFAGINGRYQVVVPIELDGRFIQVRTIGYLHCPADHPHVDAVLRVLGELNYKLRLTKFGWDPTDGEIVGYGDVWIEDGDLTQAQFAAIFKSLLPGIDLNFKRIGRTIETGQDPGEVTPADVLRGTLPPELQGALDQLGGGGDKKEKEEGDEKEKPASEPGFVEV